MKLLLTICFFFSGATSLLLEIVWAKQLSYSLGNSLYATATVISAFMGGLGIGSYLASLKIMRNLPPLRTYAVLQVLIGLLGLFSVKIFIGAESIFTFLFALSSDSPGLFLLLRFLVVFLLLLLPTTLMGMTFPIVSVAAEKNFQESGTRAGVLYGANTIGAVVGTVTAGYILIPAWGLQTSAYIAAGIDLLLAVVILGLAKKWKDVATPNSEVAAKFVETNLLSLRGKSLRVILFFSGFFSLMLELAWFRILSSVFGATAHALSCMLGVFLLGIGLGAWLGAWLARFVKDVDALLAALLFGLGILALCVLFVGNLLPSMFAKLIIALTGGDFAVGYVAAQFLIAAILILPATILSGALFTIVVKACAGNSSSREFIQAQIGRLYSINTLGAILGSLLTGFWLLPQLGTQMAIVLAAGLSILLGVMHLLLLQHQQRLLIMVAGLLGFGSVLAMKPSLDYDWLNRGAYTLIGNQEQRKLLAENRKDELAHRTVFFKEGLLSSIALYANEGGQGAITLRVSGKVEASSDVKGSRHLLMLGHLPALFAREPASSAVIGFGAGITSSALLAHSRIAEIRIFELESAVIEAAGFFAKSNRSVFADPKTKIILDDGRTQLAHDQRKYDVLTTDPLSPILAGAGNLYTREFYEIAAKRLKPGGVFCQWIQTEGISEDSFKSILKSLAESFPHIAVFHDQVDMVVLAANDTLQIPWSELQTRFQQPGVSDDFSKHEIYSPLELMALYFGDRNAVLRYLAISPVTANTDDNARVEYRMPMEMLRPMISASRNLLQTLAADRLSSLERLVPGVPLTESAVALAKRPPIDFVDIHDVIFRSLLLEFEEHEKKPATPATVKQLRQAHEERRTYTLLRQKYLVLQAEAQKAITNKNEAAHLKVLEKMWRFTDAPNRYQIGVRLVQGLIKANEIAKAKEILKDIERYFPIFPQSYLLQAEISQEEGDRAAAQAVLARGLALNPGDSELSKALLKKGKPERRSASE